MKIFLYTATLAAVMISCQNPNSSGQKKTDQSITMVLVRHAEKIKTDENDPGLTAKGKERALRLAALMEQQNVTALYSTDYQRTRNTLLPLSTQKSLEINEYDPRDDEFLPTLFSSHSTGATLVIAGHSNTIPKMVNMLIGSEKYQILNESDYNDIFLLTGSQLGDFEVIHLTY